MTAEKVVARVNEQVAKIIPGMIATGLPFTVTIEVDEELYTNIRAETDRVEVYEPWECDDSE